MVEFAIALGAGFVAGLLILAVTRHGRQDPHRPRVWEPQEEGWQRAGEDGLRQRSEKWRSAEEQR